MQLRVVATLRNSSEDHPHNGVVDEKGTTRAKLAPAVAWFHRSGYWVGVFCGEELVFGPVDPDAPLPSPICL